MFIEEKYDSGEIVYPADYDEVMDELHQDEFDCDEYFGATIDLLHLETGFQVTVLLSWWLDQDVDNNFIIIND
tara:strand:- start:3045 stop:3263 length:219 start_codon:yes stop_codon:yes gene_type:complete